MKLFEITNGYIGDCYVRILVIEKETNRWVSGKTNPLKDVKDALERIKKG